MKGSIGNFFAIRKQYRINLKNKIKNKRITKIILIPFVFVYSIIGYNKRNGKKENNFKTNDINNTKVNNIKYITKVNNIKHNTKVDNIKHDTKVNNIKYKPKIENVNKPKIINKLKLVKNINFISYKKPNKKIIVNLSKKQKFNTNTIIKKSKLSKGIVSVKNKENSKTNNNKNMIIWIKSKNNDLKNIEEEIKKLENDIINCISYKETYSLERKVKELLDKLIIIKNEQETIKNKKFDNKIKELDIFNLKDGTIINDYINRLNDNYKKIYETKKKILNSNKKKTIKDIKKVTKVSKKEVKIKTDFELINENILNQIKYYKYLLSRKRSKINILNDIMFTGLNFYYNPILNFKSNLNYLVSLVTLSNCLKTMYKLLNNNDENYLLFNYQEEIVLYNEILYDIFLLKNELNNKFSNEQIANIINELNNLENEFTLKVKSLNFQKTLKRNMFN